MKSHVSIFGLSLLLTGVGHAAAYSSNFDSGLTRYVDLAGQDNWDIVGATPVSTQPDITGTSFLGASNMLGGPPYTSEHIAVQFGGNNLDPGNNTAYLFQPYVAPLVGNDTAYAHTEFKVAMNIADSQGTGTLGNRDTFGFSIKDSSNNNLFSINFTPQEQAPGDPTDYTRVDNVTWSSGGTHSGTIATQTEGSFTTLELTLWKTGVNDVGFAINSVGSLITSGTIAGLGSANIASFGAYVNTYSESFLAGSNVMVFDDISLVPEPSSALLGLVGASFFFVRRRRA